MNKLMKKSLFLFLFLIFIFPIKINAGNFFITSYAFNDSDAPAIASKYDIIITSISKASAVSTMKSLKPSMKAFYYRDALTYGSTYYVLDVNTGKRIVNAKWGWYLRDISNDRYRNDLTNSVVSTLGSNTQFDGVHLDDCWLSIKANEFYQEGTSTPPTLPSNLVSNWQTYMTSLIQRVKSAVGSKLVIINASPWASNYVAQCDGQVDEGFGHANWDNPTYFLSQSSWVYHVNTLASVSANSKYYLTQSGVKDGTTQEQVNDLVLYCFASFLMGAPTNNNAYAKHYFCPSLRYSNYYWYLDWERNLGNAIGNYYQISGTNFYRRDFEKGIVLVNPTTQTGKVVLEKAYCNLAGQTVSEIDLLDHKGMILLDCLKDTTPPAPPKGVKIIN